MLDDLKSNSTISSAEAWLRSMGAEVALEPVSSHEDLILGLVHWLNPSNKTLD